MPLKNNVEFRFPRQPLSHPSRPRSNMMKYIKLANKAPLSKSAIEATFGSWENSSGELFEPFHEILMKVCIYNGYNH